jgi:hypothetical protein
MQRTRLNTLVERTGTELTQFFSNPWRRISLILLGLLFGFFIGGIIIVILLIFEKLYKGIYI